MDESVPQESGDARIAGQVDGCEGSYVTGWAHPRRGTKPCRISVTDENGHVRGEGDAAQERPDLASLGLGRSDFAFRIPVPTRGDMAALHVFADGVELDGSPLPWGKGRFDGDLHVREGCAVGWVTERVAQFAPPRIEIAVSGGAVVAGGSSQCEDSGDPGFAPARFRIPLLPLVGGGEIGITALAGGVAFARATCTLRLIATLDIATLEHCAGWMFSPDAPWAQFAVEIRRDGELIATAACDLVRDDVKALHPGSHAFGFDVKLPRAGGSPEHIGELSLRLAGSRKELFGGPLMAGPRGAVIAAVRRMAQTVHDPAAPFSLAERSFLQRALADYAASLRQGKGTAVTAQFAPVLPQSTRRLTIVIPVYRGVGITEDCIASVLRHRNAPTDFVVIVNDASPDDGMAGMLARFAHEENLLLLANPANLGFVKTVNRALDAIPDGDVVLLNADTEVFAGTFDALARVAHRSPEIGTVTPLSNNATIFSYPHAELRRESLSDVPWQKLAEIAQQRNADAIVDVPTAHGFCMLIRREVLHRVGSFDESFGRGYGEENDFCAKAADLGFRNVAAGGIFVYHRESVSFAAAKTELLAKNLSLIASRYPEYIPAVMAFEREDRMRSLRWALDGARLAAAREAGAQFSLVVTNGLEGGTAECVRDIAKAAEPGHGPELVLSARKDGFLRLDVSEPLIRATFSSAEWEPLFRMLTEAKPARVAVHQVLGYDADFIRALTRWIGGYHSVFHVHDYFSLCPRVTMIDASGSFCGRPEADVCNRCLALGGAHEASRLDSRTVEEHRALLQALLARVTHVVAPSQIAAQYIRTTFSGLAVDVIEHPESGRNFPAAARDGSPEEILVLGAIGPHKGSQKLLEIARLARLRHPELKFRLVGYSDIDKALLALGNVEITGPYAPDERPRLIAQCKGRLALFLQQWPETYSYTLSEAVSHGFVPLVPDIGAPAERVRETGFGVVFPFPVEAQEVLALIADIAEGRRQPFRTGASPALYSRAPAERARLRSLLGLAAPRAGARVA
ncbi:MAG TPA: glycosyltransferase [Rhizomicrobium sp.]|jgi:GT2 family glycosyltransferase/glycosyltransferase involved in cell wall biosynthesis|nr:glycosyltransferase [Rhizomicrobium sp.]